MITPPDTSPDRTTRFGRECPIPGTTSDLDKSSAEASVAPSRSDLITRESLSGDKCLLSTSDYQRLVKRLQSRIEALESRVEVVQGLHDREARRVRLQRKVVNHLRHHISDQVAELKAAQATIETDSIRRANLSADPARDVRVQSLRGALMRIAGVERNDEVSGSHSRLAGAGFGDKFDAGEFLPVQEFEQTGIVARVRDTVFSIGKSFLRTFAEKVPA